VRYVPLQSTFDTLKPLKPYKLEGLELSLIAETEAAIGSIGHMLQTIGLGPL
jgi:hypothetical protein